MAHVITAIITVTLILVAVVTLTAASLSSANEISIAWETMTQRTGEKTRTALSIVQADTGGSGTNIDISIRNSGQVALRNFSKWDVVLRYYATNGNSDLNVEWLTYTTGAPTDAEWTVQGIYIDAAALTAEVYDPNVLNPGEEMIVRLNITPAIPSGTDNLATIGVTNGITLSAPFTR